MKKPNIIKEKSFDFAIDIINLYKILQHEKKEFVISKQVLRCGTAIGALVRESEHAESKADFIHKLAIAQKEANETEYWLELLYRTDYISKEQYQPLNTTIHELNKILASILITMKNKK